MAKRSIPAAEGAAAVRTALAAAADGTQASRDDTATAVRYLLQVLADEAPGNSVEVRVPPFGATQAVEGPRHTRGTPPNVIEMDAATWLSLATGTLPYADALSSARLIASGSRADLSAYLPLRWTAS